MKRKSLYWGFLPLMFVASCANEEVVEVNSGPEIAFSTRMTRADVINSVADLKEFKVYAKAEDYDNVFIPGEIAKKDGETEVFKLDNTYHWPSAVPTIEFWAYSPASLTAKTDIDHYVITYESENKYNKNNSEIQNSGNGQQEFLYAYKKADRTMASNVVLKFGHALSQIEIYAKNPSKDASQTFMNPYNVYIKGAWIVNVYGNANFKIENASMNWETYSERSVYGVEYDENDIIDITEIQKPIISNSRNNKSGLMVIPQSPEYWNISSTDNNVKTTNPQNGAYILILCRIEAIHSGATHPGTNDYVKVEGSKHIHQMFPTLGSQDRGQKVFNSNEYGYVCVPISDGNGGKMTWEAGKKYTYVLEFCGHASGAGLYPPQDDITNLGLPTGRDGYTYMSSIPKESEGIQKTPGDPVLDNPIQFKVSVAEWDDKWADGNKVEM